MKSKIAFVLLSALLGAILYFALSLLLALVILTVTGEGPHGYGTFLYIVLPMYMTPAGLIAGLGASWLTKEKNYKKLVLWLGILFIALVGIFVLILTIV